ncbi:MAG: EAL domain-containing protein [Gammaproteobacteria bacterium]|nr:EAL domain-containing protein [Gammaproteobacteria bacterium]
MFALLLIRRGYLLKITMQEAVSGELRALNAAKDEFLAKTSHELRTPLIGIIGVAETLKDGGANSPEFIRNRLGMIVSSGKRLSKLVDDILDVTRLKEGKLEIFPKPLELREFVAFTIETFSVMFNQPQERVVNAIPLGSIWVQADESRLEQVLFNLLSNALKYAPMGEVVIDCSVDEESVTVRVCDKGIGVPDAMKASIFEDFAQAHTDSGAGGVGLGLPICRYLLALHGGRIWVEDNPVGQGSCFLFTLPRVCANENGAPASRPARERPAVVQDEEVLSRPGPGAHVLVADDERVCRCVMGDFLADAGYRVSLVRDGGEAIAFMDAHDDVDLICVDVVMPVASGLAVCQHVRERYPLTELPILVMSAKTQMQDIVAGLSVGANDYVAKPVDKGEFLARVTNLLALRSAFQLRKQRDEAQDLARASMRLALHHANTDSLTGLPLRNVVNAYLQDYVADGEHACGALFVDLDRLGKVNASYGHSVGDEILKQTAGRLRDLLKGESHVVRFEGDQFLIALGGMPLAHQQCYSQLVDLAGRCVAALAEPFHVAGNSISIASSLGISLFPFVSQSVEELIRHSSIAMRHAKSRSSTHFLFYEASMEAGGRYAFELESRMREALKNSEFELHYQPQIDIASGGIGGVEALIRWRNPDKGLVPPGQFIPLAEENGFIVEIGRWVLEQACRDYCRWREEGLVVDKVAVNLSAVQFREDGLVELVAKTLRETGMPAENLELEITESATMDNMERTLQVLRQLHGLGCILSIDDFGTGYSSLSYLKQFPVHALKIDQSFVRDVLKDEESRAIIQSIITLAHSLHLHTIAEGIETAEQYAMLAAMGSEEGQGYFFSKPLPEPAFLSYARNFMPQRIRC